MDQRSLLALPRRTILALGAGAVASLATASPGGAAAPRPKMVKLLRREDGLGHPAFVARWRGHAALALGAPGVARYSLVVLRQAGDAAVDGVAELAFVDEAGRAAFMASSRAAHLAADLAEFTAPGRPALDVLADETVVTPATVGAWFRGGGRISGRALKFTTLLRRRPELSHEAFARHWREVHAPLAVACPGIARYTQSLIRPGPGVDFDGLAELYFEDQAARDRYDASPEKAALLADGEIIMAQGPDMVRLPPGEELVAIPSGWTPSWSRR